MKRRALLLSGGIDKANDRLRYARNVAAFHDILLNLHGFAESDVRVCIGAGGAYPLAGGRLVRVERAGLDKVIDSLRWLAELEENDLAFLMVTDHGSEEGISLWGKSRILTPGKLGEILGASRATKVLVLGQCHSGRFGDCQLGRAVVCCACGPDEQSYNIPCAKGVEPMYCEFLYQLADALAGRYPDGTLLDALDPIPPPDRLSIGEAFRYAHDHDRWITGTRRVTEQPRIIDPLGIAGQITLGAKPA